MNRIFLASASVLAIAITTAKADIINTVGLAQITAPALVTGDFLAGTATPQAIFAERQGVTLAAPLTMDTGTIAAGTVVDSYWFAVNVLQATPVIVNTAVTFSTNVLGITFMDGTNPYGPNPGPWNPNFALSDFLGLPGTTYQLGPQFAACGNFCGFEVVPSFDMDSAKFAGATAMFFNNYSTPGDFARIVVEHPAAVPGPIVGAGLPGLLALAGLVCWRRFRGRFARG